MRSNYFATDVPTIRRKWGNITRIVVAMDIFCYHFTCIKVTRSLKR